MTSISSVLLIWISFALGFTFITLCACYPLWRIVSRRKPPQSWPDIALLRPCEGDEPGLKENLASSLSNYPGNCRVILLVPSESDPSYPIACAVADAAQPKQIEVLITHISNAPNRKSAHLAAGLSHILATQAEPPEAIVQADSDARLDDHSLPQLLSALYETRSTAAAFAVPIEPDGNTIGDLCASALLSASHQDFFALAALSRLSNGVVSLAGAFAAHRTKELVATGGFSSLENLLGEDFEVGCRLRAKELKIAVSSHPVICAGDGRTLSEIITRTTRWAMVVRRQRGFGLIASYPLLLGPTPLVLLASLPLAIAGNRIPLFASLMLLVARAALAYTLRRIHLRPVNPFKALKLALAGELLMLAAFPRALFVNEVVWRGRRLHIGKGGTIGVPSPP